MSLAVTVAVPTVFSVTLKVLVPEESAAFTGRLALPSLEVIPTVSVTVLIKFQFASTAFTVTVNTVPPCSFLAVPSFPLVPPGAAAAPATTSRRPPRRLSVRAPRLPRPAARRPWRRRLPRHQELQLRERPRGHRDRRARARGLAPVRDVGRRDRRRLHRV